MPQNCSCEKTLLVLDIPVHTEQPATCYFQQPPERDTSPQVSVCVLRALSTLCTAVKL